MYILTYENGEIIYNSVDPELDRTSHYRFSAHVNDVYIIGHPIVEVRAHDACYACNRLCACVKA